MGPIDREARPGLASFDPPQQGASATPAPDAAVGAATVTGTTTETRPDSAALAAPTPGAPVVPHAPTAGTQVVEGWSLENLVGSIAVSDTERAASGVALSADEVAGIAAARRADQQRIAAEQRTQQQRQADERRTQQAAEREQAAQRAEAAEQRANPARTWVQVATGGSASVLAADCRRLATRYTAPFEGQSCSTAQWNRNVRLLVGPFRNTAAAREWLNTYSRAGGDGFIWASEQGEVVTPVAGAAGRAASGRAATGAAAGTTTRNGATGTRGGGSAARGTQAGGTAAASGTRTTGTRATGTRTTGTGAASSRNSATRGASSRGTTARGRQAEEPAAAASSRTSSRNSTRRR